MAHPVLTTPKGPLFGARPLSVDEAMNQAGEARDVSALVPYVKRVADLRPPDQQEAVDELSPAVNGVVYGWLSANSAKNTPFPHSQWSKLLDAGYGLNWQCRSPHNLRGNNATLLHEVVRHATRDEPLRLQLMRDLLHRGANVDAVARGRLVDGEPGPTLTEKDLTPLEMALFASRFRHKAADLSAVGGVMGLLLQSGASVSPHAHEPESAFLHYSKLVDRHQLINRDSGDVGLDALGEKIVRAGSLGLMESEKDAQGQETWRMKTPALRFAIEHQFAGMAVASIDRGDNLNEFSGGGSPLLEAGERVYLEKGLPIATLLLNKGARPDYVNGSALVDAAEMRSSLSRDDIRYPERAKRQSAWIRALVEAGANVHAQSPDSRTALHHLATREDCAPDMQILLAHGADVHGAPSKRKTPAEICAESGNIAGLMSLREAGCDLLRRTHGGGTLLHAAAKTRDCVPVVQYLLDQGLSLKEVDQAGDTPLHYAARANTVSAKDARELVHLGGSLTVANAEGLLPFDCTAEPLKLMALAPPEILPKMVDLVLGTVESSLAADRKTAASKAAEVAKMAPGVVGVSR
jgi:ankyrin repeat protein